jgi:hypothetical protein
MAMGGMKMRAYLVTLLVGGAIAAVVGSSNSLAAPANGAAIIGAAQTTGFVQDIAYCTRTDNRGRIIFRRPGHCTGRGVTCWSDVPHRSKFLHWGRCKRGEGGF